MKIFRDHAFELAAQEFRFWDKVNIRTPWQCWEWAFRISKAGYGEFSVVIGRRTVSRPAHRIAWEYFNGPIPNGLVIRHRCDNRKCVNPFHLDIGTKADNSADMVSRGRHVRGSHVPTSVLTEEIVKKARTEYSENGNLRLLCLKYGASAATLSNAIHGKTWKHVDGCVKTIPLKGHLNPRAKLTCEQVVEMRKARKDKGLSYKELGCMYGVAMGSAWRVCKRKSYAEV